MEMPPSISMNVRLSTSAQSARHLHVETEFACQFGAAERLRVEQELPFQT